MSEKKRYLILDSRETPLAYGLLESGADGASLVLRVLDGETSAVMEHEEVRLIASDGQEKTQPGRILRNRGDLVEIQKVKTPDSEARQNFRMPVRFDSFIYPLDGAWKGRCAAVANDLSSGGIAFYCDRPLEEGEQVEIVIPVTVQPLVLRCQIIRRRPSDRTEPLYAAKFVDLCHDEEALVRKAVFSINVHAAAKLKQKARAQEGETHGAT